MPTEWTGYPETDREPMPPLVALFVTAMCTVMVASAVIAAWALAQLAMVVLWISLAMTLGAAGLMLLGIDYAEFLERERMDE